MNVKETVETFFRNFSGIRTDEEEDLKSKFGANFNPREKSLTFRVLDINF